MSGWSAVQVDLSKIIIINRLHLSLCLGWCVLSVSLMLLVPTGGNAGMAAAYSARQLGVPATIVVPSVTPNQTVERLNDEGATVVIQGKVS